MILDKVCGVNGRRPGLNQMSVGWSQNQIESFALQLISRETSEALVTLTQGADRAWRWLTHVNHRRQKLLIMHTVGEGSNQTRCSQMVRASGVAAERPEDVPEPRWGILSLI